MPTVERAVELARTHHAGQKDKAGNEYIAHPLYVMDRFPPDEIVCRIVGVLHDVPEDTEMTLDDLRSEGFSEEVILALDAITLRPCETHDDYLRRVMRNPVAWKVKIEDVRHNLRRSVEAALDAGLDGERRRMFGRMAQRYAGTFKTLLAQVEEPGAYAEELLATAEHIERMEI